MKMRFKQALYIDGKFFPLGVHEVSEESLKHKHFLQYIKLGLVLEASEADMISPESPQQRGARLHEKLHVAKPKAPAITEESAPLQSPVLGEQDVEESSDDSEQKDNPKKKSKTKR